MQDRSARKSFTHLAALALLSCAPAGGVSAQPVVPQAERSDIATMKPMGNHWFITRGGWGTGGMFVFDGDDAKMQGEVVNYFGDFAIDPNGRYFYTSETFYAHRNRGARDDVLTIWDARTLKVVKEITLPGRMIIGQRMNNLALSADGRHAFIYNMMPSSSVITVDLDKQAVEQTVELPGCAGVFPDPANGFTSLCSNGGLASVSFSGGKPVIARSKPFFNAILDPIWDNSVVDAKAGRATFLSYSGLVYQTPTGSAQVAPKSWSLQEGAEMKKAEAAPLAVAWYPGGSQPLAVHNADNHIYVLMHLGEYWSHTEAGSEVWMLDGTTHKLIRRTTLPDEMKGGSIAVTQGDDPKIFVSTDSLTSTGAKVVVLDGVTLKKDRVIEHAGGGNLWVRP